MMPRDTSILNNSYNGVAKFLHWSIALLIIGAYILGLTLDETKWYTAHKQIGMTILLLVLLRMVWRFTSAYPKKLESISSAEDLGAKIGQILLYILMFAIPVSGIIMVQAKGYSLQLWGIIPLPTLIGQYPHETRHLIKEWHLWMAHAIIFIAAGHGLIALVHHFVSKDNLLRRMLPNHCNKK